MPFALLVFYRILGVLFLVLAAAALWEKYRLVRGASLLPGRILACKRHSDVNPRSHAGGWRYTVEVFADGRRLELETNDAFWFEHKRQVGQAVQVWYKPGEDHVERKSPETELYALLLAALGVGLLILH